MGTSPDFTAVMREIGRVMRVAALQGQYTRLQRSLVQLTQNGWHQAGTTSFSFRESFVYLSCKQQDVISAA